MLIQRIVSHHAFATWTELVLVFMFFAVVISPLRQRGPCLEFSFLFFCLFFTYDQNDFLWYLQFKCHAEKVQHVDIFLVKMIFPAISNSLRVVLVQAKVTKLSSVIMSGEHKFCNRVISQLSPKHDQVSLQGRPQDQLTVMVSVVCFLCYQCSSSRSISCKWRWTLFFIEHLNPVSRDSLYSFPLLEQQEKGLFHCQHSYQTFSTSFALFHHQPCQKLARPREWH